MLKQTLYSGCAIAAATTTIAIASETALAATLFTADLDGLQVVSSDFPSGIPTTASGFASFELNDAQTELSYFIDLDGVDLKANQADRTAPADVTKIHIHVGAIGQNGPHTLNIFGLPREDDADLSIDFDNGILQGTWDDLDAINPDTGLLFDQNIGGTTKQLSNFTDALSAGGLYLQVHTVAFDSPTIPGELRGQIQPTESVPEPSTTAALLLGTAGLLTSYRRQKRSSAKD